MTQAESHLEGAFIKKLIDLSMSTVRAVYAPGDADTEAGPGHQRGLSWLGAFGVLLMPDEVEGRSRGDGKEDAVAAVYETRTVEESQRRGEALIHPYA